MSRRAQVPTSDPVDVADDRRTATAVGILFVVASVAAIVGGLLVLPVEDADTLGDVAGDRAQVVSGVVLEVVLVLAVVGIAALLVPVLRRRNEGMAFAYLGARTLEAVLLLAAAVGALVFVTLGADSHRAVTDTRSVADLIGTTREQSYLLGSMVVFGVSAVILNAQLLSARLVPRWLSGWGLAGGVLILARGVIELYGTEPAGAIQALFAAPIAVNEMVLAVWLIVRGFDPAARPA